MNQVILASFRLAWLVGFSVFLDYLDYKLFQSISATVLTIYAVKLPNRTLFEPFSVVKTTDQYSTIITFLDIFG